MSATAKALPGISSEITAQATVTSKGQVTIPVAIRRQLGAKAGDKLTFRADSSGVTVTRKVEENVFEKFRGRGLFKLPPGYEGREGIIRYFREIRGHDEIDDQIAAEEA